MRTVRSIFRVISLLSLLAGVAPALAQTPAGAAKAAATAAPTRSAENDKAAADARGALCERYLKVLAGQEKADATLLSDRDFQITAARAPSLTTCGAIATDSDALCAAMAQAPSGFADPRGVDKGIEGKSCRRMQFIFHELRTYPKGRSFLLPFTREECASLKDLAPSCTAFVDALRAGDASKCASTGSFQALCNAFIAVDDLKCAGGKGLPDDLTDACKEMVVQRGFLAAGLEKVEKDGPPDERTIKAEMGDDDTVRAYVKAALGRPDACDTFSKAALEACVAAPPLAASTPPAAKAEAPAPPP